MNPVCRANHDRWVIVESFDKMWSTGEDNGKPLQYACFEKKKQNEKGKQDNFKKNELMNDYNEYFIKIFLNLEKKKR